MKNVMARVANNLFYLVVTPTRVLGIISNPACDSVYIQRKTMSRERIYLVYVEGRA